MGTWGTGIFQDDVALDIKDSYTERVRKGEDGERVTADLIAEYQSEFDEPDTKAVFWLALADTQWKLGRLEPEVKERALQCIRDGSELERWESATAADYRARKRALSALEERLMTPQPAKKTFKQPIPYYCGWQIGDVFALKLCGERAEKLGFTGRYLLMQTVDTCPWYPNKTIPIVYVKLTPAQELPKNPEEYEACEYIQISFTLYEDRFLPLSAIHMKEQIAERMKIKYERDEYGLLPEFRLSLITTSKRVIPKSLVYVGNFAGAVKPKREFIPHEKMNICTVRWGKDGADFEDYVMNRYCLHNLREMEGYSDPSALPKPMPLFVYGSMQD